jgi:hypothetical protein
MTFQPYDLPKGDTLSLAGTVLLPAGVWTASAALNKANGTLAYALAVDLQPLAEPTAAATHSIVIELSPANSANLAAERHKTDVRFADADGVVLHSPVYIINVTASQTAAPAAT